MTPLNELHPSVLINDIMRKEATYFEDLQKTVFIIKVKTDVGEYLEQREWFANDHSNNPGDDFSRLLEGCALTPTDLYEWVSSRSSLMGVSVDTPQWMDRKWIPVGKKT